MLPDETIRRAIEDRLFESWKELPVEWASVSGGLSRAAVWRVSSGDEQFAVRRWWAGIDPRRVAWVAKTVQQAKSSGLAFLAAPVGFDDLWPFVDAHDGRWEVAPWLPGKPVPRCDPQSPAMRIALEGLVRFHEVLKSAPGGKAPARPLIADRRQKVADLRGGPLSVQRMTLQAWPALEPIVARLPEASDLALSALEALTDDPADLQPIHGDARPEHFLIEDNRLSGLIDFATMRRDSPLADLARFAGEAAPGDGVRRDELVELYEVASGRKVDRAAIAALDLSGAVLSAANWLRWLSDPAGPERPRHLVEERLDSISARLAPE